MSDAPELKPCPFCGGDASDGWFGLEYNICCETACCPGRSGASEYAATPTSLDTDNAKKAAADLWNRRAPTSP